MNQTNRFWNTIKNDLHSIVLGVLLLLGNSCFSQWKTSQANNIKNDVLILYDVIYENKLTEEQLNATDCLRELTITFNKDKLVEREFKNKSQINYYKIFDYNTKKVYSNSILSESKKSVVYDFAEPKISVEPFPNTEAKTICDLPCEKAFVLINGRPKEVYYTNTFGLRYCRQFKTNGFLLEYPGYSKQFGHYTVVAKKISYVQLPESFYAMEDFEIQTMEEYTKSKKESVEKYKEISSKYLGKKASFIKSYTLDGKKIDTKKMLGDVVVLNFWFTTCAPCKAEIPKLNELKQKYKDQNVHFIAVALDDDYKIKEFFKKLKLDYEIVSEGRYIATDLNVTAYPTNIVIDKEGIVQLYEVGYKSDIVARMSSAIDEANAK